MICKKTEWSMAHFGLKDWELASFSKLPSIGIEEHQYELAGQTLKCVSLTKSLF